MQTSGNTILVTGGGSGIGRELARRLGALGNTVIVAGRQPAALRETIEDRPDMHAMPLDVGDAAAVDRFARELLARHPGVNVLINNAGIMRYDNLGMSQDLADAVAQIETNLLGPIRLTNALVDHLKGQPHAALVTVSSGLAFVPRADAAIYSATKAAVHSYSLSLRERLKGQVEVIELIPPAVQTELTPGQSGRDGYMPFDQFMEETMALLTRQPTPAEILVQRAGFQRWAEREDRFDDAFARINAGLRAAPG